MSILVTGGAGYIGSHMVLELIARGEKVVVLDDLSTGFREAAPASVPFILGDVADRDLVAAIIREYSVEAIAHFAARTVVPDSVADPLSFYEANTAKSRTLIATAVGCGVSRMIFSSTAAVYGDVDADPVSEARLPAPVSPYGRSKLMTEWILEDTAKAHDFRFIALRYFNVAGADPAGRSGQSTAKATHLIKVAVQTALGQRPCFEIFGTDYATKDGTCERDFIQVTDLAAAHLCALDHLRAGGKSGIYNCGYGSAYSVRNIVDVVKKISGVDFEVRTMPRRPGDPAAVVACADRIRAELGWNPAHDSIEDIVKQAYLWEARIAQTRAAA